MIADFLKGTVSESLNKLIQPAAVVPAMLFVLLNLAFVYPEAKRWSSSPRSSSASATCC